VAHRLHDRSTEIPGESARICAVAADACRRALGLSRTPTRARILKYTARSVVVRLEGAGPKGQSIIAKRTDPSALHLENTVYTEVLPRLALPGVRCHGILEEAGEAWLFLEDAGVGNCWPAEQPGALARWLAALHGGGSSLGLAERLPSRSTEQYRQHLEAAAQLISASRENPALTLPDRVLLDDILSGLGNVARRWSALIAPASGLPDTVVHGDLKASNIRLQVRNGHTGVLVFDWEQCGWGTPAADLGVLGFHVGLCPYWSTLAGRWPGVRATDLAHAATLGRLFRVLAGIHWASTHLPYAWPAQSMQKLRSHRAELARLLTRTHPKPNHRRDRQRGGSPRKRPTAEQLTAGLNDVFGNPRPGEPAVTVLERIPAPPEGSSAADILHLRTPDGTPLRVFCKYPAPSGHTRYGHRGGGSREAYVYENLLAASGAPRTVRCYGSHLAPHGRRWLMLEYLENSERMDRTAHTEIIYDAARWIGEFHACQQPHTATPDSLPLTVYDEQYYTGWVTRTRRYSAWLPEELRWVTRVCEHGPEILRPLLDAPRTVIHGEYYPKNIILQDDRAYPVDWESAAIAPGEIDLASLTERWPQRIATRCEQEYVRARWPSGAPDHFPATLTAARIYLHFRWLGDDPESTTTDRLRWRFADLYALVTELLPPPLLRAD
jgi:aminoglycoside phosphotransferase (APT) family kinase protein